MMYPSGSPVTRMSAVRSDSSTPRCLSFLTKFLRPALAGLVVALFAAASSVSAQSAYYSGAVTTIIGTGATAGTLVQPYGVAEDSSGDVYVTDINLKEVLEFKPTNGAYTTAPVVLPAPTAAQNGVGGWIYPVSVAVDNQGNVWVADNADYGATGGGVYSIAPGASTVTLSTVTTWQNPEGVAADPFGNVFATDSNSQIVWGVAGDTVGEINPNILNPYGITVDLAGNLWVVNGTTQQIDEIPSGDVNLTSTTYVPSTTIGFGTAPPTDIWYDAIDQTGNLWALDKGNGYVAQASPNGTWNVLEAFDPTITEPGQIAWDNKGNLLVANEGASEIQLISAWGVPFGPSAVGTASATSPIAVPFNVTASGSFSVSVITDGNNTSSDFADSSDTCSGAITAPATCTVNVSFTPKQPGARYGAVELLSGGTVIATAYLSGTGTGPQIVFQTATPTPTAIGSGFTTPAGLAVDANGNVFVADTAGSVFKAGTATALASVAGAAGVALDAEGNLFVAGSGGVSEIPFNGTTYGAAATLGDNFAFSPNAPTGVAVDQYGNVFVADKGATNDVEEAFAENGYGGASPPFTIATGFNAPSAVAVDGNENVFVADTGNNAIKEIAAVNGALPTSPTVTSLGSGFSAPAGVAVDANDNVYVADSGNKEIKEIPFNGTTYGAVITLATLTTTPTGVAVDQNGNVYYSTGATVEELTLATAPTLAFDNTEVGVLSADSPKQVTVANNGNASLIFTNVAYPAATFFQTSSSTCSNTTNLAEAGTCDVIVDFDPTTTPVTTQHVTLTDNGTGGSQQITLTGTAVDLGLTPANNTALAAGQYGTSYTATSPTFTASGGTGTTYTWSASATLPAGLSIVSTGATTAKIEGTPTTVVTAASFTITATDSGTGSSGFTVTHTYTLTINPAPLTITASSTSVAYGSAVPTITPIYSGFVNGDTATSLTTAPTCTTTYTATSPVSGSPYPTSCSGAVDPDYTITYVAGAVTVTKPTLTITASSASVAYSSAVPTITPSYSGFVNGDTASSLTTAPTCTTTYTATSPVSGSPYPTSCSGAVDSNYTITYVAGAVTVTAVPLTITASSTSVAYGSAVPTITPSYSGFVNGQTATSLTTAPTCTTTYTATSPVSGSPYPTSCSGAVDTNYTITYVAGTVTVTTVPLTITASSTSVAYGSAVPTITPSYSGFVAGNTASSLTTAPTCTTTYTATSPVSGSPYPTSCSGAVDPNYTITYVAGTVTVTKPTLTITASSTSVAYGSAVPTITPSYTGFVNGQTASSLTTAPTCTTTYTATSSVSGSPYPTSCSGAVDPNYTITYVAGAVTVTKLTVTISVTNSPVTYNGSAQAATVTGSVPGTVSSILYSGSATVPTAAGTYAVTANFTPTDATDYTTLTAAAAGNFVINKATPTLSVTNSPQPFTGTPVAATVSGSVAGTASAILYNGSATVPTAAGTYAITANFTPTDATDYNSLTAASAGNFIIGTVAPTITFTVPNHTYGDAPFTVTATSNSTGAITYSVVSGPATIAGTTVTLTGAGSVVLKASQVAAGNYLAGSQTATFTVAAGTPTITWSPAASIAYGTTLTGELTATAKFGGNSIAGSFAYTATPTGGSASAVTASTVLAEGSYTLTATFTPTDTTDYKTATANAPLTVTGATLTVSASNATKVYGTANPTFTGSVTGQQNGDTFTETFTTTATATSNVGTYPIVPSAAGSDLSDYTVVINDGTLTVTQAGTTTTLVANSNSVNPGATVTLTATVASATTGTPTGTVSFYNGSTLLGMGTLSGGVATYSTTTLAAGANATVTAVYSGDTNFMASSTASSITITVAPLGFTLTASPSTLSGNPGNTFAYQLAVAPTFGAYPATVSFAANGGPAGATVSFSPTTLAANAGAQSVTMSVATSASSSADLQPLSTGRKLVPVAFALLLLPLAGTRRMRRNGRWLGRLFCLLLLALGGIAATTALSGCGSNSGGSKKTGTGTMYTITVQATSGAVQQSTTVTLTLQ